ncbi:MAG: HAMP domain-containing histidine kinase [Firmicutes bacterium]|nr:HAMP domain-containing histidine kinase [Bacillota bacterium]
MIKRLRRRVIAITMLAVFVVLFVLMGVANLANYHLKDKNADELLEILAENGGRFPHQGPGGGQGFPGMGGEPFDDADNDTDDAADDTDDADDAADDASGDAERDPFDDMGGYDFGRRPGMSEETPFETRFFSVTLNSAGQVSSIDTGQIAAVTTEKATEMTRAAAESGKTTGYNGNYKYLRAAAPQGDMYIFLDCTRDIESCRAFLRISTLVSLIGFCAIFILVVLLSPAMIRPIAESYEKQKRFITDAGHELKTPLAVIESCTEVVEMQNGESKWTAGIRDQVKRMTDLTGALVSLARMDEAGGALELSDVDLSAIIEETLKPFALVAEQQGKSLVSGISPGVTVKGSDAALRQLVSILADNAVKYSSEGAEIRFSLGTGGKHAVLTASNPAEGLKPGNREELFDRFYRGDSSRSSEKRGYGIGLSMARAICEACGGTISAQSPDGSELVIKASFPLA